MSEKEKDKTARADERRKSWRERYRERMSDPAYKKKVARKRAEKFKNLTPEEREKVRIAVRNTKRRERICAKLGYNPSALTPGELRIVEIYEQAIEEKKSRPLTPEELAERERRRERYRTSKQAAAVAVKAKRKGKKKK